MGNAPTFPQKAELHIITLVEWTMRRCHRRKQPENWGRELNQSDKYASISASSHMTTSILRNNLAVTQGGNAMAEELVRRPA